MVVPERDMPGTSAAAWAQPMSNAPVQLKPASVRFPGPDAFRHHHGQRADDERAGGNTGRAQVVFDEVAEQEADDHDRNGPDGDEAHQPAHVVGGRRKQRGKRSRHSREVGVEVGQDRRERADVQRHVEGQTELGRRFPAEEKPRQDQVGGARDRKKLGQSLNDAEQYRSG